MEMIPLDRYESCAPETRSCFVPWRLWFLYAVAERVHCDWLGSGYRFVRYRNGLIRRFWTRAQAQAHADKLNDKRHSWAEVIGDISAAFDKERRGK